MSKEPVFLAASSLQSPYCKNYRMSMLSVGLFERMLVKLCETCFHIGHKQVFYTASQSYSKEDTIVFAQDFATTNIFSPPFRHTRGLAELEMVFGSISFRSASEQVGAQV